MTIDVRHVLPLAVAYLAVGIAAPVQAQSITPAADGVGTIIQLVT